MDDMIIKPTRGQAEPLIPARGILCANPVEANMAIAKAAAMRCKTQKLYNSNLVVINGNKSGRGGFFVAGPAVGAPMAVLTLEKLIALGAREITALGWCGAIDCKVHKEDIILPVQGISGEGTSQYYPLTKRPATAVAIRESLKAICIQENWQWREGLVWTTDAPYRESREQVSALQEQGVLGVDMEFTALLQVAAFRKVELAAMLLVSDELWQDQWQPSFTAKSFKKKSKRAVEVLLEAGTTLNE